MLSGSTALVWDNLCHLPPAFKYFPSLLNLMKTGFNLLAAVAVVAFLAGSLIPFFAPDFYSSFGFSLAPQQIIPGSSSNVSPENISLYLCPDDDCSGKLISFYGTAQKSIHVMIYSLTLQEIADALVDAKERGIEVKVLFDKGQSALKDAKDEYLVQKGIDLKIVDLSGYHIMHDKVSIVDGNAFSTGSFNYTQNADTGSAENLVIINDNALSQKFEQEFSRYWPEG